MLITVLDLLITVLAIRKSTAKRGSLKRIAVRQLNNDAYAYLKALIAVLIVEGPETNPLIALIAVDVNEVKKTTGNFVKVLVDQFDGFTKDVFHGLLPSITGARRRRPVSGAARKATLPSFSRRRT